MDGNYFLVVVLRFRTLDIVQGVINDIIVDREREIFLYLYTSVRNLGMGQMNKLFVIRSGFP